MMQLLPAIDLLGGRVVRLARGNFDAVTIYNDDPLAQAQLFADQGVRWLHVVDLDGARTGTPFHLATIEALVACPGLSVEVGGGVRSLETVERLAQAGAQRIVIGTQLISDPEFCRIALRDFGDLICAGVDARNGEVAIEGWREGSGVPAVELIAELAFWGVRHLVYTDIIRDGMQTGIDGAAYQRVAACAGFAVTASGGIGTLDDLRELAVLGDNIVEGAIVGRAIYEGNFTPTEALQAISESEATHVRSESEVAHAHSEFEATCALPARDAALVPPITASGEGTPC
ncbi:MAG: 1-(5-phosphoribosyl)-5-[(5-phosphoribosylamino)methylideneamino] imidazole-4-carboxamide isomerase [Coriobacteriales bacterium]|jgi:phosphoribosylformimino-5-aminoimidazole carboxamide ribotide isomerase|nr:1-(5-phosphoribosyl)-5-[(5-phosphoribosylamino)methylideneamino] imidazole-4-carboxamide isomerase [Coriobacteriales bacterium]